MLHADAGGWQSHRNSTHDRLMSDTSMGKYATERDALLSSRNAALHLGRERDAAMLDPWAQGPTSGPAVSPWGAPQPHAAAPPHAAPPPHGYASAFAGADGTRHDPRFVDARHRPSDAEISYLRRELSEEQRRLLALEEQLGQVRAAWIPAISLLPRKGSRLHH